MINQRVLSLVAFSLLSNGCSDGAPPPQQKVSVERLLFLGNSITRHPPAPQYGWPHDWGMAASTEDNDFVHLVTDGLAKLGGKKPKVMLANIGEFEQTLSAYNIDDKLKSELAFQATLAIVAIGENVKRLKTNAAKVEFEESFRKLLEAVTRGGNVSLVVRGSFYSDKVKDQIMKRVCDEFGGTFVDISMLSKDEFNFVRSERKVSDFVALHPGDKGMKAIADAILNSVKIPKN